MKQSPEFVRAQRNMLPGVITADGFLGTDKRNITDIILADEELFQKLELDFSVVCAKLRYLLSEGSKGLGEPITVDNRWLVRVDEARGVLPSPFEHDGVYHKLNVEVRFKDSSESLIFSDLSLHLMEKYHFLQGKGSAFRLEPQALKTTLGL